MSKKLVMLSGGMDSLAMTLEAVENYGKENVTTIGFNYGQRHFIPENRAAFSLCDKLGIKRAVLNVPIDQIGGCSLIDKNIPVTTDMTQQRSTVVPMRNSIFLMFAAAYAQVNDCDSIYHGACKEDFESYRDCRPMYFNLMEAAIQAGITQPKIGTEDISDDMYNVGEFDLPSLIDIKIVTPLIHETKGETMKRILTKYPVDIYKHSYTCYNGVVPSCGKCPACIERLNAFKENNVKDPIEYAC